VATTDFEVAVPYLDDAEQLASVHVQAWREAYGELLREHFYDDAAQLWVAKNNGRARRFYERNGFRADGTEQVDPDLDALVENRMVR
jgi:hypothetical protein